MDLPGSMVRDAIALRNPLDQLLTPLSDENRTSGRDLLRRYGLASNQDTWGNFIGGLAAETLLDPTNLIGGGFLSKRLRDISKARSANKAIDAANALSREQRAMGFMPEEIVPLLHKSVLDEDGMPKRFYHGTAHVYDTPNKEFFDKDALYGPGHYMTDAPHVASSYVGKGPTVEHYYTPVDRAGLAKEYRRLAVDEYPFDVKYLQHIQNDDNAVKGAIESLNMMEESQLPIEDYRSLAKHAIKSNNGANVRMAYVDVRNPLDIHGKYTGDAAKKADEAGYARAMDFARAEARKKISVLRRFRETGENLGGRLTEDEAIKRAAEAFSSRNTPKTFSVGGSEIFRRLGRVPEEFDGVSHIGGLMTGGLGEHNVIVAMNPDQLYKPYIASKIQDRVNSPADVSFPVTGVLAAYNAAKAGKNGRK